jgi:hypothetical protein
VVSSASAENGPIAFLHVRQFIVTQLNGERRDASIDLLGPTPIKAETT